MTSPWSSGPPPATPGGSRPDWDFSKAGKQDTRRRGHANGHATGVVSLSAVLRQPERGWVTPDAREAHQQQPAASRLPAGQPAERRVPASAPRYEQGGSRAPEVHFAEADRPDRGTSSTDYYLSLTQRNRDLLSHLRAPRTSALARGPPDETGALQDQGDRTRPAGGAQHPGEEGGGGHHTRSGSFRFSEAWSGFVKRPGLTVATPGRASTAHAAVPETATANHDDYEQPESPQWVGSPGHEVRGGEGGPSPSDVLEQLARRVEDAEARAHEASQAAEARAAAAEAEAEQLRHAAVAERAEAARLATSLAELQAWSRETAAQLVELRAATGALVMQAEDTTSPQDAARVLRAEAETEEAHRVAAQALRDAAASAERATAAKLAEAESRREAAAAVAQLQTALAALHGLKQAVHAALHAGSGTPAERLAVLQAALGADA